MTMATHQETFNVVEMPHTTEPAPSELTVSYSAQMLSFAFQQMQNSVKDIPTLYGFVYHQNSPKKDFAVVRLCGQNF